MKKFHIRRNANRKILICCFSYLLGIMFVPFFCQPISGFISNITENCQLPTTEINFILSSEDMNMLENLAVSANGEDSRVFELNSKVYTESEIRVAIQNFIFKYRKKHLSDEYHIDLVDHYFDLIEEDGSNLELVLQFVALCSVESNFDQYVPTKYGAGIAQVIYRIHKEYIKQLGVSKEDFYNSPKHNILVGYNLFWCYWKNTNKTLHSAATRYNGGGTRGYSKKVEKRYKVLLSCLPSGDSSNL